MDDLPAPIRASLDDLPAPVRAVLAAPAAIGPGERSVTEAAEIPFASIAWGETGGRPLVLLHGVTASAAIWWRVGPALAATGRRVMAPDLPGHGLTGHWAGRYQFRDNAADIAAWIRAVGLDVPEVQIVGHSWGAMTAAALPRVGIRPSTLVLLDPPAVPLSIIARMANDPAEVPGPDLAATIADLAARNPAWSAPDVRAKAEALLQLDVAAARAIVLENGDWDAGLTDLSDPTSAGIPTWIVRGDPAAGGYLPDVMLPALAARVGAGHILTLASAPHAPQRLFPEATTLALLRALA